MEKKNILTGVILLSCALLLGLFLESQMNAGPDWKLSSRHSFWKAAHLHGMGFGILITLYGFLLKNYCSKNSITAAASYLAIAGSLLPVGLFLAGIQKNLMFLAPIGGFSMAAAYIIMAYSIFTGSKK